MDERTSELRTLVAHKEALEVRIRATVQRLAAEGVSEYRLAMDSGIARSTIRTWCGKNR